MRARVVFLFLPFVSAACVSDTDGVIRENIAIYSEYADALGRVVDESSAIAAQATLQALEKRAKASQARLHQLMLSEDHAGISRRFLELHERMGNPLLRINGEMARIYRDRKLADAMNSALSRYKASRPGR